MDYLLNPQNSRNIHVSPIASFDIERIEKDNPSNASLVIGRNWRGYGMIDRMLFDFSQEEKDPSSFYTESVRVLPGEISFLSCFETQMGRILAASMLGTREGFFVSSPLNGEILGSYEEENDVWCLSCSKQGQLAYVRDGRLKTIVLPDDQGMTQPVREKSNALSISHSVSVRFIFKNIKA
jgi:hypothetical protein